MLDIGVGMAVGRVSWDFSRNRQAVVIVEDEGAVLVAGRAHTYEEQKYYLGY